MSNLPTEGNISRFIKAVNALRSLADEICYGAGSYSGISLRARLLEIADAIDPSPEPGGTLVGWFDPDTGTVIPQVGYWPQGTHWPVEHPPQNWIELRVCIPPTKAECGMNPSGCICRYKHKSDPMCTYSPEQEAKQ